MARPLVVVVCTWLAAALAMSAGRREAAPQGARAPGAKVTFERLGGDGSAPKQSQRARLLSLAVERNETATPFVEPGMFRATYTTTIGLPARDRFRFRVEGRGTVKLTVNGEPALDGALRPGKPLETAEPFRLKKGDNELQLVFDSQALGDGQFRLYWAGSDHGFEPIPPERLSFAADDADVLAGEQRRHGMQLFAERRCARCHDFEQKRIGESAFAELDDSGPDLRSAGARLHRDWIAKWLQDPRQFRPDATMPAMALSDDECGDLAAWLASLGGAPAPATLPTDAKERGKTRFRELGCVACHVEPDAGNDEPASDRIALAFVPQKWQPMALVEYLREPARNHPGVRMPDLKLAPADAEILAGYLLAAGTTTSLPKSGGDAARGKRLAQKHGCALCHGLDVELSERQWPRLRNAKPDRGCLGESPDGRAPDHGFDADERQALRSFLAFAEDAPFRRAPLDYLQRHLTADRCTACHALDGRPSGWATWAERQNAAAPLPKTQDPIAQGVPALTWVGGKLQPSWIERFVLGEGKSPRPWLTARMPAFHRRGGALAQGLVREHGYGPQDEPPAAGDAQLSLHGERLLAQGTGFGCVQCHAVGDQPATQVFEREGIELLTARARLRHEYYTRWLADPPRLDPDSRMPKYADAKGKTAFTEVLGGDAARQFEAIWQYLGGRLPRR